MATLTKGFGSADTQDYYKIVLPNSNPDQMLTKFTSQSDAQAVIQSDTWIANSPAYNGQELYLSHHLPNSGSVVVKHYSGTAKVTAPVIQTPVTLPTQTVQTPVQNQDATQTTVDTQTSTPSFLDQFKTFMTGQKIPNVPNYVPVALVVVGGVIVAAIVATK